MSGPRLTTGENSKQDYSTPDDFLMALQERFGEIRFDLAAHAANKKHSLYFAPEFFGEKYDPDKTFSVEDTIASLIRRGAEKTEVPEAVLAAVANGTKHEFRVRNSDLEAYALDAFAHDWSKLPVGPEGLLWLNCEFSDIEPWATKCKIEAEQGAHIALLTPASMGANWFRDRIAGSADVYMLNGRLCFDGKNVFPKDCILSHFHPKAKGDCHLWEWKKDKLWASWKRAD